MTDTELKTMERVHPDCLECQNYMYDCEGKDLEGDAIHFQVKKICPEDRIDLMPTEMNNQW